MKLFSTIVPVLAVLLLSDPVTITYAQALNAIVTDTELRTEYTLDGNTHIGYMPRFYTQIVDSNGQPVPHAKMCGQWFKDGVEAKAPNIDRPVAPYCRETDENGKTFFAYRDRVLDATGLTVQFKVIELNTPSIYVFPTDHFITLSF